MVLGDALSEPEAGIVPVSLVFTTWIAQARYQPNGHGGSTKSKGAVSRALRC